MSTGKKIYFSTGVKFTFLVTIFLTLITVLGYFLVFLNTSSIMRQNMIQEAKWFSKLAARPLVENYNLYYNSGFLNFVSTTNRTMALTHSVHRIQLINVNGNIEFDTDKLEDLKTEGFFENNNKNKIEQKLLAAASSPDPVYINSNNNPSEVAEIIYPYFDDFGRHVYSLRYFIDYSDIQTAITRLAIESAVVSVLFLIITWVFVFMCTKKIFLNPLNVLQEGITEVEKGRFGHTIMLRTGDDMERLSSTFNQMSKQIEYSIKQLKDLDLLKNEFINLASHHLRTPVTVIRSGIEMLKRDNPGLESSQAVQAIDSSLSKLHELSEDLISITSLEDPQNSISLEKVDLAELISRAFKDCEQLAQSKNVELVNNGSLEKAEISANPKYLSRALLHIVKNAINYNKDSGKVYASVQSYSKEGWYLVRIEDTGEGISSEKLSTLFKKFHRGINYLNANVEGEGLGLYIVKLIVGMHGGEIWVESTEGKGTTFFIALPEKNIKYHIEDSSLQ